MWLKVFAFLFFVNLGVILGQNVAIECDYRVGGPTYPYQCALRINNPDGFDDFEEITGEHLEGFTNANVSSIEVFMQNTANVPRIICSQFPNLQQISFILSEVVTINDRSFSECGGNLESVTLIYNNIVEVPANTFRNNSRLEFIYLANNFINSVHSEAFAGSAASYITLEFNELPEFDPTPFIPVNNTLRSLSIFNNAIVTLPSAGFINLRNLEWLDLTANEFQSLPDDAFDGLVNLQHLYAIACNLREPRAAWFSSMSSLVELHLELNEITSLASGVFSPLRRLTELYLGYNELTQITSGPFLGIAINLEKLSVPNNQIFAMHAFFFQSAENLETLELTGNICTRVNHVNIQDDRAGTQQRLRRCFDNFGPEFINCVYQPSGGDYSCMLTVRNPNGIDFETIAGDHVADRENDDVVNVNAFEANTLRIPEVICRQFRGLQNVAIVSSYVEELSEASFSGCVLLQRVDLSYNGIQTISSGIFAQNPDLIEVNLRRNEINRIDVGAFTGSAISSLDLSYNEIFDFSSTVFEGINGTLRSLDLTNNRIAILNPDTFENLRNLEEIIFNGNSLYIVPSDAFVSLTNLQTLGLSNCNLQTLNPEWFTNLNSLRSLYIASNGYSEFPTGIFNSLENLVEIYFYGNRLVELQAEAFGSSLNSLTMLYGTSNEINLIDSEILMRGTSLQTILLYDNLCTQSNFYNVATNRDLVRDGLSLCVGNFEVTPRVECEYELNEFDESYSCHLEAVNPGGRDDFEEVGGEHLSGNGNDDVTFIQAVASNTLTIPSVLCTQFPNLNRLDFTSSFLASLTYSSFTNCLSLTQFSAISNNISTVPALVFSGASNLETLSLSLNRIHTISASAFYGTRINHLDLSHNEIDIFDSSVYGVIGNTLTVLRLTDNRIQNLPVGAFDFTPLLIELELSHNHLYTIPSETFTPLANLQILQLLNCGIEQLDERWFRGLDELIYLQLSGNEIDFLHDNIFDLPQLETIGLADNNLRILDSNSFGRSLTSLFHIDASNNRIDAFDPVLFENSTSLFGLELENNLCISNTLLELPFYREYLREYLSDCFGKYEDTLMSCEYSENEATYTCELTIRNEVERLRFERVEGEHMEGRNDNYVNNIYAVSSVTRSIPTLLCHQFPYIESIVIVESQIEILSLETFKNCEFLYILSLAANRITNIPNGVFSANPYLASLNLALNRIETISHDAFAGTQIYFLDLEDNHLTTFDPVSFAPIASNLFYLYLRHNRYNSFPRNAFATFRNLRTLNLNGNRLDFLPSNAFRSLTSLNSLELADCGLNNINYRWFDDLQNLRTLEFDMNGVQQLPNNVFDLPNLQFIGLAANRLTELNSNAFGRSLQTLRTIRAEDNEINAIDPAIIDNANELFLLTLTGNVCVNVDFIEVQEYIEAVRQYLSGCFGNFES